MIPKSRIAAFLMSAALMASLNVNAESIEVQNLNMPVLIRSVCLGWLIV